MLPTETQEQENQKLRLYKHRLPSARYIFGGFAKKDEPDPVRGREIVFVNHLYATSDPDEIKELDDQIKRRGFGTIDPIIYVDPQMMEVTPEFMDPVAREKARMREELLQELQETGKIKKDGGSYVAATNVLAKNTRSADVSTSAPQSNSGMTITNVAAKLIPKPEQIA